MKKSLLLLAAAATFGTAQAQKMGDVFIYGGISYNSQKTNISGVKTGLDRTLQLNPGIGYQFDKNWGAGVQLEYAIQKTGATSATEETNYSIAPGIFVRYTQPLSPMFFVYGQFNASYLHVNLSTNTPVTNTIANGFSVGISPAAGINLSRCVSLIGTFGRVGYQYVSGDGDVDNQNLEATIGNQFGLTVQWNFGKAKRGRREPMSETRNMDRYRDDDSEEVAPSRRRKSRSMDRDDN